MIVEKLSDKKENKSLCQQVPHVHEEHWNLNFALIFALICCMKCNGTNEWHSDDNMSMRLAGILSAKSLIHLVQTINN